MAKDIGETVEALLAAPLTEEDEAETAALLVRVGLEPNRQNAILLQLTRQAGRGDIRSVQLVRELTGLIPPDHTGFAEDLRRMTTEKLEGVLCALTEEEE